jgi:Tfp pilus assembly protein FimT
VEENKNPNGVNNEAEVVKKAAPPPMKKAKKGETSQAVLDAAKKAVVEKNIEKAKKEEAKKQEAEKKEAEKGIPVPVVAEEPEVKTKAPAPVVPEAPAVVEATDEIKEEPVKAEEKPKEKAAPVVAPVKKEKKQKNTVSPVKNKITSKNLKIIIPIIAVLLIAIIVAVVLVSNKDRMDPVVVTDENGVPVTDVNGDVITVTPETGIYYVTDVFGNIVTDEKGNPLTTVEFKDVAVQIPVTDMNGVVVTDANGNAVTQNITIKPTAGDKNNKNTTSGNNVGTTSVLVTDGKGNTGVDEQGNLITTIVNITEAPTINIEPAKTEWKNTQGGSAADKYEDVILTSDDCYITTNVSNSKDGDFAKYKELGYQSPYTILTKYNNDGEIVWQKAMGSPNGLFEIVALSPCKDGSFYAVGFGRAIEDISIQGYYDGAVYKLDKNGNVQWVRTIGTSTVDLLKDVVTASNGDAIVVGSVGNNDGDAKDSGGNENESKAVIMRYSSSGDLKWKKYAGGNMDTFVGVAEGTDGSIYALGNFYSGKLFPALGKCDSGVVKYSKDGKVLAKTSIAGTGIDEFKGITATSDGGVIVCGSSDSVDSNETNPNSFFKNDFISRGSYDSYMIKYTSDLKIKFVTPVRGQNIDTATSVLELPNGTYIMAGSTNSSTRDFKGVTTRGKKDIFVAGVNSNGTLMWVRSFGGTESDGALALCKGADGGYVVVGETFSNNVDLDNISPYGGNGKTLAVMIKFPE